jgi:hypothetical protein
LPRAVLNDASASPDQSSWSTIPCQSRIPAAFDLRSLVGSHSVELDSSGKKFDVDPEELATRAQLASRIIAAGEVDLAALELDKILILEPDQIEARMNRVILSIDARRFEEAQRDLDSVLNNPGLIDHSQKYPTFIRRFHHASRRYCLNGKFQEGRAIARRALDVSITLRLPRGESQFNMARAYAMSARTEPQFIAEAANQLYELFVANPLNQNIYASDPTFGPVRDQISAEMRKKPDPTEAHRRGLSTPLADAN